MSARHGSDTPGATADCRSCRLFVDRPDEIERALPGLTILSSASGSTRGRAGICLARETFQDPEPACPDFEPAGS